MRQIDRGCEPDAIERYLRHCESEGITPSWPHFATSTYYGDARQKIHGRFGGLCAYCEEAIPSNTNTASIDHFRPQHPEPTVSATQESYYGSDLTFAWCNWQYACGRCQEEKGNKWPGSVSTKEDEANKWVSIKAEREGWQYTRPCLEDPENGYVDPTDLSNNPQDIFTFDEDGRIIPRDDLDDKRKSIAWRTIFDLQLNTRKLRVKRKWHFAAVYDEALKVAASRRRSAVRPYCRVKDFKYDPGNSANIQYISFMAFAEEWLICGKCLPKSLQDTHDFFKEKETTSPKKSSGRASGGPSLGPRGRRYSSS